MPHDGESPFPAWEGLPLIPTYHAVDHLYSLRMDLWDLAALLEAGEDCEQSKRRAGMRERCGGWRGHRLRVVLCRERSGWVDNEEAWIVIAVKPV